MRAIGECGSEISEAGTEIEGAGDDIGEPSASSNIPANKPATGTRGVGLPSATARKLFVSQSSTVETLPEKNTSQYLVKLGFGNDRQAPCGKLVERSGAGVKGLPEEAIDGRVHLHDFSACEQREKWPT